MGILPNKSQNFSAYALRARFLIGDNALICRNDSDSETAKYLRQLFLAGVYTQTRLGDSLQTGDDLLILILSVFQSDTDGLEVSVFYEVSPQYFTV